MVADGRNRAAGRSSHLAKPVTQHTSPSSRHAKVDSYTAGSRSGAPQAVGPQQGSTTDMHTATDSAAPLCDPLLPLLTVRTDASLVHLGRRELSSHSARSAHPTRPARVVTAASHPRSADSGRKAEPTADKSLPSVSAPSSPRISAVTPSTAAARPLASGPAMSAAASFHRGDCNHHSSISASAPSGSLAPAACPELASVADTASQQESSISRGLVMHGPAYSSAAMSTAPGGVGRSGSAWVEQMAALLPAERRHPVGRGRLPMQSDRNSLHRARPSFRKGHIRPGDGRQGLALAGMLAELEGDGLQASQAASPQASESDATAVFPSRGGSFGRGASPGMPPPAEGRVLTAERKDTVELRTTDDFTGARCFQRLSIGCDTLVPRTACGGPKA